MMNSVVSGDSSTESLVIVTVLALLTLATIGGLGRLHLVPSVVGAELDPATGTSSRVSLVGLVTSTAFAAWLLASADLVASSFWFSGGVAWARGLLILIGPLRIGTVVS